MSHHWICWGIALTGFERLCRSLVADTGCRPQVTGNGSLGISRFKVQDIKVLGIRLLSGFF
jgi:hypothetical protein